ncbi:ScpA family protein [Bacteriovorax sp. Seq25_V]|uniref:segregation and condensation protein A n=1 Tax=Bacteriovorax sp. Seq25_V TaxID=1201288 RepID=UPI00038A1227|nr:segregation/condensation protein A [Bacteriovorax sp. Seq25_V]EQC44800.1 ScpA/B protein [Bacteriovorax sp. Seq25_V]
MLDTTINVKTDFFDGPLSLLLMLIQKEQMSVKELDLTKITKQYLDYLADMKELNFDIAGDYLYLASTLVLLKSKNCITEEENTALMTELGAGDSLNITSQAELIRRLEELQHFQKMGQKLWELPKKGTDIFVKPKINRQEIVNSILTPMDLEKLTLSMVDFLFRENRKYTVVKRDRLSIKEKLNFLKTNLSLGNKSSLNELLDSDGGKTIDNVVITFISLLELARLKRIEIFQNESFGNVYVDVVRSLEDFDVEQADGFDEEEEGATKIDAEDLLAAAEEVVVQSRTEELENTQTQQDEDSILQ